MARAQVVGLARVAPLQGADRARQETTGNDGYDLGMADAKALCDRLSTCVTMGEMDIEHRLVYVYLDVDPGTHLSTDYWAGWASAVYDYLEV